MRDSPRRVRFTEASLRALRAPTASGRQELWWDTDLRGFGVLLSGSTNGRSYVVQRDLPGGRTRRVTIGPTNVRTLEEARAEARTILNQFHDGIDPRQARREAAARGATLGEALDMYLRTNRRLRASSTAEYTRCVHRHLADWVDRPIREITREDVERRHAAIARKVAAEGRYSGEQTANAVMRVLRAIWNAAADRDPTLGQNPVRLRREWFAARRRTRCVRADEMSAFWGAVQELENPYARGYVTLLLFTGMRRREAASLRWDDVDFAAGVLRVPEGRTKSGRKLDLPLTTVLRDMLVGLRAIGRTEFVFPAASKSGHLEEPSSIFDAIEKAGAVRVSPHDLRRTFVTTAEACDISQVALKALVNHSLGSGVTEGYVIIEPARLREAAQRVCDRLAELCCITAPPGVVVMRS
ncbi:tyrosine-type recombinase/integrase [Rhodoplanes elegans]|uniref:tyrosine-type recombinase/integrase n=1 Tax=Rhodoplanes elegans TaxID=29408 RepID=UPI001473CED2|nr:integrase family protein [Rhodoplanes elegans]